MGRTLTVLGIAAIIVFAGALPASADTWVQLRYWGSNVEGNYAGFIFPYTASFGGIGVRHTMMGGQWALSLNYDRGTTSGFAIPYYNIFWNVNLHRNFMLADDRGSASLFVGWGSAQYPAVAGPSVYNQSLGGLRVGADAKVNLRGNWYLAGEVFWGPSGTMSWTAPDENGGISGTNSARVYGGHIGVGYMRGMWGLEGGYRVLTWDYEAAFCSGSPCYDRWSGWYAGLNIKLR